MNASKPDLDQLLVLQLHLVLVIVDIVLLAIIMPCDELIAHRNIHRLKLSRLFSVSGLLNEKRLSTTI